MVLRPIHDDHAIDEISFEIVFTQIVPREIISYLRENEFPWSKRLPAKNRPTAIPGIDLPNSLTSDLGIEFSRLMPDGLAAWSLFFHPQGIIIKCREYTRWKPVWAIAKTLITESLTVIQEKMTVQVRAIGYIITDIFESEAEFLKANTMLKPSKYVPNFCFNQAAPWHAHMGWFQDTEPYKNILNQLDINVTRFELASGGGKRGTRFSIVHRQYWTSQGPLEIVEASSAAYLETFEKIFSFFHSSNKIMLNNILEREASELINLGGN